MTRLAIFAAITWLAICGAACAADEPCPDRLVDVYLSPLKLIGRPPNQSVWSSREPGPPHVHLRLPRQGMFVRVEPGEDIYGTDCRRKEFVGYEAQYHMISQLARGLNLPYDQPKAGNFSIEISVVNPGRQPPSLFAPVTVDDADDREGIARKGVWTVRTVDPKLPFLVGQFCLNPPAPAGQCYAFKDQVMVYHTGEVVINSGNLVNWTLESPPSREWVQVTVADLDSYFTLLRRIADAVVVPSLPSQK